MEPKQQKDVFTLVERGERTFFVKSGRAFHNNDDSWTLLLDTLPVSGKLQMRESKPQDKDAHRGPQPLFPEVA